MRPLPPSEDANRELQPIRQFTPNYQKTCNICAGSLPRPPARKTRGLGKVEELRDNVVSDLNSRKSSCALRRPEERGAGARMFPATAASRRFCKAVGADRPN
jgi:hypothetical protein